MTYAQKALTFADGTGLTTEQRLELALSDPTAPAALTQHEVRGITQNRIRAAMSELSHQAIPKVQAWLDQVAEQSPAKAIELFLELAQFTTPKLKAVAVDVRSSDGSVKTLSVKDLESIVAEG